MWWWCPTSEVILAQLKAELAEAMPQYRAETVQVLALESEPLTIWLQRLAYQLVTGAATVMTLPTR